MKTATYIAVKIPLSPSKTQGAMLRRYAGCARWVFNWALARKRDSYALTGKSPSACDLTKEITQLKKTDDYSWLREISKHIPEQAISNCDAAFKNFFRRVKAKQSPGYPKFKSRFKATPAFSFGAVGSAGPLVRMDERGVTLPKIGFIRSARRHVRLVEGRAIRATVRCENGRWWCSVVYEVPAKLFVSNGKTAIGVDLGITTFATLSSGEKINSPKPLKKNMKRLKRLQRRLSASQRGSNRREKKRLRVSRLHERIRNIRTTFLHGITAMLAKNHGEIYIEDLSVRNMMRNRHLSGAIGDLGWGLFRTQLEYKSAREGAVLVVADRWYPSSKTCSHCGQIAKSLPLSVREWRCDGCGSYHDRDINAAKNLVQLGANSPEVTRVEIGDQDGESHPVPVDETRILEGCL